MDRAGPGRVETHLVVVLADTGRSTPGPPGPLREVEGRARTAQIARVRARSGDDVEAALGELRIVREFPRAAHARERQAHRLGGDRGLLRASTRRPAVEHVEDRLAVALALVHFLEARLAQKAWLDLARHPLDERRPVAEDALQEIAVAGARDAETAAPVQGAAPCLDRAVLPVEAADVLDRGRGRRVCGDVDGSTGVGACPAQQREQRSDRREQARRVMRLEAEGRDRWTPGEAVHEDHARRGGADQVRTHPARSGPAQPEGGDRDPHQRGPLALQVHRVDAELAEPVGRPSVEDHVGVARKFAQPTGRCRVAGIDDDAALARVVEPVGGTAGGVGAAVEERAEPADRGPAGRLDADHVGAEIAEQARAEGATQVGQVEHAQARERAAGVAWRAHAARPRRSAKSGPASAARSLTREIRSAIARRVSSRPPATSIRIA